jgi:hypothetical protein
MRLVVELNRKQLDALEERGYLLRDLRTAKQSIQDQQKQIRGQYNRRHARNRKHQGFPRFVVTSKPLDLHGQRSIKNLTAAVTSTHGDEGPGARVRPRSQLLNADR